MNIEKLISEYKDKIEKIDKIIKSILLELTVIRRKGTSAMTTEEWSNVKKVAEAQRQCYVQFIEDLKEITTL